MLHKLLRVSPQASVLTADVPVDHGAKGKSRTSNVQEERDGDMELQSDDDARHEVVDEGNSDESGKYDIQERHPRSGRANGTGRFDPPTTYTTDEEDLSEDELEDQAYDTAGSDDDVRKSRMGRRRSYWLSKGVGPHDRDDGDEVDFVS